MVYVYNSHGIFSRDATGCSVSAIKSVLQIYLRFSNEIISTNNIIVIDENPQ